MTIPSEHPGLMTVCRPMWNQLWKRNAEIERALEVRKENNARKNGHLPPIREGGGRPPSPELEVARMMAARRVPYVLGLYLAASNGVRNYTNAKKWTKVFRLAYEELGVEPPRAPRSWWAKPMDAAGWPDGFQTRWVPETVCCLCGQLIEERPGFLLCDGQSGIEFYPAHSSCHSELKQKLGQEFPHPTANM